MNIIVGMIVLVMYYVLADLGTSYFNIRNYNVGIYVGVLSCLIYAVIQGVLK